tara:strand:- start:246 stop:578 length:333 start_codon:yes stop_codon:yes gene_type:complete
MSYRSDPDNNLKMIPNTKVIKDAYGHVTAPLANVNQPRPSYVLVNVAGTYAFSNENSASVGGTIMDTGTFETGSVVETGGSIRLDINPRSWMQTNAVGTVGDVTFVYKGD